MSTTAVVSFIGTGNMGAALIKGLSGLAGVKLLGFDVDRKKLDDLRLKCPSLAPRDTLHEAVSQADYIILCVKPQMMRDVLGQLRESLAKNKCLISIAAGITSARLGEWSGHVCPVARVMPNTPALVGESVSAVCLEDPGLTQAHKDMVPRIFATVGSVHVLPEKSFDAMTAVSGSGPAYVFYFMEALIEGAVATGLARPLATQVVGALFKGSVRLALKSGVHVSELREMVTSPAGTTAEALNHMDRMAVKAALIDAVAAAKERSIELGA